MLLQNIFIYPVKSLSGISLITSIAQQRGFKYDRRWMVVDENNKFITQRVEHKLALLNTEIFNKEIRISHKIFPDQKISIPLTEPISQNITVSIWDDVVEAIHNEEYDLWFSNYLEKPCKLVFLPETSKRPVDQRYAQHAEQVSFADAFPYLLISQASLDDLNSKLPQAVPMNRFRPNLVIKDTSAFEEDTWSEIMIGEVHFKVAKPCARCILTTVNQETGAKETEPLKTLAQYRSVNNKILFGQNLIALNEGKISVNDPIKIISTKNND